MTHLAGTTLGLSLRLGIACAIAMALSSCAEVRMPSRAASAPSGNAGTGSAATVAELNRDVVFRGVLTDVDAIDAGETAAGDRWVRVTGLNQTRPVSAVGGSIVSGLTVQASKAIGLAKQGTKKALGISANETSAAKHLSDNATKTQLAEIEAAPAAVAPAP